MHQYAPDAEIHRRLTRLSAEDRGRLAQLLNTRHEDRTDEDEPSYQQRNFWILHQMAEHPETYNSPLVLRISGSLNTGALQRAVLTVAQQYEIYRTVYEETPGGVRAVTLPRLAPAFVFEDWSVREPASLEEINAAVRIEANKPFDLTRDSPLRVMLFKTLSEEHFLILILHHIANDGGSLNLVWNAICDAYECIVLDEDVRQVPDGDQYKSFALRQRDATSSDRFSRALAYWLRQLEGAPSTVDFAYDHSAEDDHPEGSSELVLPLGDLEERVGALARSVESTRNVVYLAAYFGWLFRETGSTDMVVGVPIDGRTRREDQHVIGCCINMLSIRQRVTAASTFRELIRETRSVMLDGMRHADLPFIRLVEEVERSHDGSFGFYNTTFQYRNFVQKFRPIDRCDVESHFLPRTLSQFPVMMEIYPMHREPRASMTYDKSLIRPARAERMLRRYRTLIDAALSNPDVPISALSLLDARETDIVTNDWARNDSPYPDTSTVHRLFEERAGTNPNATALVYGDRTMTYAELDRASSYLAGALVRQGLRPGARVGICVERSLELVVGMLAVLKSGAAYVPLDPEYPVARLKYMIEDAAVWGVLTDRKGVLRVRNLGIRPHVIESLAAGPISENLPRDGSPEDPAYLMYTSGSTGEPKGVVIPHRGIVRLVCGADYASLTADETFLHLSSPSFDVATFEIWAPLLNGSRLVIMQAGTPSVSEIGEVIRLQGVTTLWLTSGLFHLVVDEDPELFRPLHQLLAGGDVLSPDHVRKCMEACPSLRFINGYGPTENTTFSCCYTVPRDADIGDSVPIGRPIANSEAYILDPQYNPVPVGAAGELVVGGAGLALEYWRRPELTRERFIPHPFVKDPNARVYRTGDRARYLPDGTIEFLGRIDHQVKIRGFRVEPGEIEAAILRTQLARQCTVVPQTRMTTELVAYVVPAGTDEDVVEELRVALRSVLPAYMMPAHWVVLEALPLTPNGKIDRKRLPRPEAVVSRQTDPPATQLEWRLQEIFRRLFQSDLIGCEDDFFDLGGNSLLAIRMVAEVERLTGQKVGISMLFQHPTVRRLAAALIQENTRPGWTSLVPLAPDGEGPPLFVTHGVGGELFALNDFGRMLGETNHRVFGLQAVEHTGSRCQFSSFESMAAHYTSEILSLQPTGPYYLFGFSLGGMVAFEVAAQLRRSGHEIGMLFLADVHPPNLPRHIHLRTLAPYLAGRVSHHLRTARGTPDKTDFIRGRIRALKTHLRFTAARDQTHGDGSTVPPPEIDFYQLLGRHYVPEPTPMPVTLIQASRNPRNLRVAWTYLAQCEPSIVILPGSHLDLLQGQAMKRLVQEMHRRLCALHNRTNK